MAPMNTLSVLAFASAALATPYQHGHSHAKYHNNRPSGFSVYPIAANGTAAPYGTGLATGTSSIAPVSETSVVSDIETATAFVTKHAEVASSSECASEVTVTSTAKVTVTVTPGASSQSSSSEAAAVQSSSASSPAGYESAAASSSEASPAQASSESSAPVYSQPPSYSASSSQADAQQTSSKASFSAYSAPSKPTMTYAAANKNIDFGINYGAPSSSSAAASSAAPSSSAPASYSSSGKSGKRGVAYNDAKLTDCLVSSPSVSWGYNWGSSSSGLSKDVEFIPMLWGPKSEFTDSWSDNAKDAIKSGSKTLFSFNEPDLPEQANLTPQQAADAYKQYMEPLASDDVKICAPSVTNGSGDKGLGWLSSFLEACSDCTIDCLNIHWYDSAENVEYFKKHVNDALDLGEGKKPVYVSEFAATGSDDQISQFLETVMPWMDGQDNVAGYAYFMAGEGKLVSGSEQSAIGKTYASS